MFVHPSTVTIGGVSASVHSSATLEEDSADGHYRSFRVPAGSTSTACDMDVEVLLVPPDVAAGRMLFDCDGVWGAFEDPMGYRIVVWSSEPRVEHLVARCDPDTSRVVIHVGETWNQFFSD
ncbi:MAG: hypothetical protein WCN81_15835, partial [Actinomycetes bacterium]